MNIVYVFIGGGLGSVIRYLISLWWIKSAVLFPFGTLVANLIAAIVLAFFYFSGYKTQNNTLWLLMAVGFCGGLSTFSTFSLESYQLLKDGHHLYAWLNIGMSVLVSVGVFYLGSLLLGSSES